MTHPSSRRFLSSAAALFLPALAFAAPGSYDGPKWTPLDQKKELAAAAQITQAKYPDSDSAIVDEKIEKIYRPDGTGEAQDETYQKVLTERGIRDSRTVSLYFQLPYETVSVPALEVIHPDGTVTPVDVAANSKEMIDDGQMSANIYDPNSKILRVNIPQLDVGDIIHSICRTTTERSVIPGEYADGVQLEGDVFIRHTSYEVEAPKEKPLKHIVIRDEIPGTVAYSSHRGENGSTIHHWEIDNVPRMFPEPSMPSESVVLQRLLISTTPDWATVSKWYWNLSTDHLTAQVPEMKETVDKLTANAKTDKEKMAAIFHFVSDKIRYMGLTPEKDRPGFEPHDVKLTFCNKYGVCRDKAALLVSMLRLAGFKAYPVLTNFGAKIDPDVPEANFNHAIACVEQGKGHYMLMDSTDEHTGVFFPAIESDQSYLVCRPGGETLLTSAIDPSEDNMVRVKTDARLEAGGKLKAKTEIDFEGFNDDQYRTEFSETKPDDRERFFETMLKRALPGATLESLKITPDDMGDVSTKLKAVLEYSVDDSVVSGGGKAIVNLPWLGKHVGIANAVLRGTELEKRKYPMRNEVACGVQEDVSLDLGQAFRGASAAPSTASIHDPLTTYERRVECGNGMLHATRTLKLNGVEYSPAEYLKLKDELKEMDYDARREPVLAVSDATPAPVIASTDSPADPPVDSNATVLEQSRAMNVTDAHTATYKFSYTKKILSYEGKKQESEIKLHFNPSCQDVKFVKGIVTSKTGERQEISKAEINVLDEGWDAAAKRYTGGKILVANLPGVEIGSTIEVEFDVTVHGKPIVSRFEPFRAFDDVDKQTLQVTVPANLAFQKTITGPAGAVAETSSTDNGTVTYTWSAQNQKALPQEPSLPPPWTFCPGVGFFAGDAQAYLTDLRQTMLDRSSKDTAAAALAKKLTANAKSKLDAAIAIRDYVAKSIRAAGPPFTELPLSELSAADTTLADGYGHDADQAILLYAMLSAAGFQPDFVLGSNLPVIPGATDNAKLPSFLDGFTAPLVRVTIDGKPCYLNDSDQYAQPGTTPHDGDWAIALSDLGYQAVQPPSDCENRMDSDVALSLADNGNVRIDFTRRYYGSEYNAEKKHIVELTPEEKKRYYQEIVSSIAQGARPATGFKTDFTGYPGVESYSVEVDRYGVVDGNYMYFDLPGTPSLFTAETDQRTLPLYLGQRKQNNTRIEINLPKSYGKLDIAPAGETLTAPDTAGNVQVTAQPGGKKFIVTDRVEATPAVVQPRNYPAMLKIESTLGDKSSKAFLLEKS